MPEQLKYRLPVLRERFPECALYSERIIDGLRKSCPLSRPDPLAALGSMEGVGWRRYGVRDYAGGIRVFDRAAICGPCIGRLIRHPIVASLRADLEVLA